MKRAVFSLILTAAVSCAVTAPAAAIETIAREAVMIEMKTGKVLLAKGADQPMAPASMSKLMTLYMLFERLRDGSLSVDDTFRVSENAWRKGGAKSGGSTMFLEPNKRVRVEDLIRGIIVQSGNDACIVVAEGLSGSEDAFADEMNERGRKIGLKNSTFRNSTGWPHPEHRMTPMDLAHLARRTVLDFPQFYHYYAETKYTYNGITQNNRNPLLYKEGGADGLKTGYTSESGYGLVASAIRNGRRLFLVVNGLTSKKARGKEPERLLDWGFRNFKNYPLFEMASTVDTASVWLGKSASVPLVINQELVMTLPRKSRSKMQVKVVYDGPIPAPITKGDEIAKLVVTAPGHETVEVPLSAGADVPRLGLFGRISAALKTIIWGGAG